MLRIIRPKGKAKLLWLQNPSEINGDNLNKVRREGSRYFRNEKGEHLKGKINLYALDFRHVGKARRPEFI
jgi:hypothetical protein